MVAQCGFFEGCALFPEHTVFKTERAVLWDTQGNQGLVSLVSRISVFRVLSCGSGCLHEHNLRYSGSASWLAREGFSSSRQVLKRTNCQLKDLLVGYLVAVLYIP
jgi:hypothetical protein